MTIAKHAYPQVNDLALIRVIGEFYGYSIVTGTDQDGPYFELLGEGKPSKYPLRSDTELGAWEYSPIPKYIYSESRAMSLLQDVKREKHADILIQLEKEGFRITASSLPRGTFQSAGEKFPRVACEVAVKFLEQKTVVKGTANASGS